HWTRSAASRTACTAGRSRPIRTAMMAMTTSSSMSVNAPRSRPAGGAGERRRMTSSSPQCFAMTADDDSPLPPAAGLPEHGGIDVERNELHGPVAVQHVQPRPVRAAEAEQVHQAGPVLERRVVRDAEVVVVEAGIITLVVGQARPRLVVIRVEVALADQVRVAA